ncbi:chorismate mutase [Caloranaerobacter azorensis]|uniref:chorismate mutase n=1 Tax=Caloranaerobacter azorensis TaxID=116090 RepID=A0A6P1YAZ3_9FIRM|nr:chorismate mutase [Caloranaerobacter azorensis]QIB26052.1 chorismate mutase [Caloranaerobacter azorensis]
MCIVTIRGAITVNNNTREDIIKYTKKLLEEIIKQNNINKSNIISILFSATKDLNKAYPAIAARELGLNNCGLMCFQEMDVENSLNKCIRVLVFLKSNLNQIDVKHIYLEKASVLRPDLN